jgi:hypothetical protein
MGTRFLFLTSELLLFNHLRSSEVVRLITTTLRDDRVKHLQKEELYA